MRLTKVLAVTAAGLLATTALASCDLAQSSTETHAYQVDGQVTRLVLTATAGRIEITTGDGPISVSETYRYNRTAPTTRHETAGGTLTLTDDECAGQHVGHCEINYSIRVPAATAVQITTAAGTVDVSGLAGDLTVTSDAGRIDGTGLSSAHTTARTNAGVVSLAYRLAPQAVTARSDAGSVSVLVPAGDAYAVDAGTDAGKVTVEVPRDAASTRTISAHSDAGKVEVGTTT